MSVYEVKEQILSNLIDRVNSMILSTLNTNKLKIESIKSSFIFDRPIKIYENKSNKYNNLIEKLEVLNPLNTLKRGYSITRVDNKVIKSIKNVKINDEASIHINDKSLVASRPSMV